MYDIPHLIFPIDLPFIWMRDLVRFVPFDIFSGWKNLLEPFQPTLAGTCVWFFVCSAVTEHTIV
jgi:hypothetical protein